MADHNDKLSVVDTDPHFTIDVVTRSIISNGDKKYLVQFDHNSERITFECPRYIEGHDMMNCNKVLVNYLDVAVAGVYEVEDLKIKESATDTVCFSWLVSCNSTAVVGALRFAITFSCVQSDGTTTYKWNTGINEDLKIISSISNDATIAIDNVDILEQWKTELFGASDGEISKIEQATNKMLATIPPEYNDLVAKVNTNADNVSELKSDTSRIKKSLKTTYVDMNLFVLGTINKDTGEEESSNKILRSIIDVNATEDITIKLPKGYQWNVAHWLAGKYRSDLWNENGWYQNLTIEKTTANYKYRILIRRSDGADITLSELIGAAETNREDLQSFDKIDDLKKKLNEVDKKVDNLSIETDTTLTKTGKAADSAVVGQQIGELKEDLENVVKITETKSTNKLNFTDVEEQEKNGITMSYQDNVLSLNGTASATTEFTIPLAENLSDGIYKFYYELLEGDFNQNILYGYQSNAYAQFTKNTTTVKDITINGQNRSKISLTNGQNFENCKFHIWAESSSEATGIFSIPGTTQKDISFNDDLEIPQVKENESKINNIQEILETKQEYEIIDGKMVYKNGEIKSDTNSVCINLKLEAGDTIVFKASGSANHAIMSESTPDFGKVINIITVGTSNDEMMYKYTADQDIYIVLSCRSNKAYSVEKILYSEKLKSALLDILNTKEDYRYLLKVFEGKKGLCIGDSLTYGVVNGSSSGAINTTKNYPYWFNKMTNLAVDVDGHPGWTASQMYERVKSNNYEEYSFILLFLGTNGGLTTDEQISAYKQIIKKFISDNNDVKIFLITPFTVNGYSKQDTVDKIYDIGKEKEIAVVNADIAPFKYTVVDGKIHEYDITHLSEMGYFLLANVIANGMGKGIYDYLKQYNEC